MNVKMLVIQIQTAAYWLNHFRAVANTQRKPNIVQELKKVNNLFPVHSPAPNKEYSDLLAVTNGNICFFRGGIK